jgi:hypothetical protein
VAMIDDDIRRTRCVVCDAEHEYKAAKVPARRKTAPVALFTQVLDGLQGPTARPPSSSPTQTTEPAVPDQRMTAATEPGSDPAPVPSASPSAPEHDPATPETREDGPVRRPLIRAQFPRTEGQPAMPRVLPEFTVHSLNGRGGRSGGGGAHRAGGGHGRFRDRQRGGGTDPNLGPMRFARDNGHGQGDGSGRPQGQRHGGRRRRGGKKNQ